MIVIGGCGCMSVINDPLYITDGDNIPYPANVGWLKLNGVQKNINKIFPSEEEMLSYFNTTFVQDNTLNGKFYVNEFGLYYTNPEKFNTGEIMITFGLAIITCRIGTPPEATNAEGGYDVTFPNGTDFSSALFYNMKEVQVRVGNIDSEPISGFGHQYLSSDPLLPTNGIIKFPYALEDTILYVTLTQKP